jgi:hypothetical protein
MVDLSSLFLRNSTQSSLRDWRSLMTLFLALKRQARIKSRSAAEELKMPQNL